MIHVKDMVHIQVYSKVPKILITSYLLQQKSPEKHADPDQTTPEQTGQGPLRCAFLINDPHQDKTNKIVCVPSKYSDQAPSLYFHAQLFQLLLVK